MKMHRLKILSEYAEAIYRGDKNFEIRINDRDFEVGDLVTFNVIFDERFHGSMIIDWVFNITYITDYEQKDGYVVFGMKRLK